MSPRFSTWILPINSQQCATRDRPVSCNFSLYNNASRLTENQKLAPDNDITGRAIVQAFIASTSIGLILSAILLLDRIKWHIWEEQTGSTATKHRKYYLRLIHVVQRLLHALSDHQLVAGLALLLRLNSHACSISVYHYNLACTMLILSAITHFNSTICIQDFIHKGKLIACIRVIAIGTQYGLSIIVLAGRNTDGDDASFPTNPSPLAIMPAACFLNMNASAALGFDGAFDVALNITSSIGTAMNNNSTANDTTVLHDIRAATMSSPGRWQYIILIVFILLASIFLLAEWYHAHRHPDEQSKTFNLGAMVLSAISIVGGIAIVSIVMSHYNSLRAGMENPQWYQKQVDDQQALSYSAFMSIPLVSSASLHGVQAITESLFGHKGRRFLKVFGIYGGGLAQGYRAGENMEMKQPFARDVEFRG